MSCDLDLFVEGHPKSIGFQVLASDPTIPSLKAIGQTVLALSSTQEIRTDSLTDTLTQWLPLLE